MTQIHDVPDDWNPDHRCCLECGNSAPDVTLRALTHPATNQQALACTRHLADVAAVLNSPSMPQKEKITVTEPEQRALAKPRPRAALSTAASTAPQATMAAQGGRR
jgi:hypothetical protein